MKNYPNVGKTRNLAQNLLLIEHKNTPFLQISQPSCLLYFLGANHLHISPQPQKSAFFCFFLLKICIYAEFPYITTGNTNEYNKQLDETQRGNISTEHIAFSLNVSKNHYSTKSSLW